MIFSESGLDIMIIFGWYIFWIPRFILHTEFPSHVKVLIFFGDEWAAIQVCITSLEVIASRLPLGFLSYFCIPILLVENCFLGLSKLFWNAFGLAELSLSLQVAIVGIVANVFTSILTNAAHVTFGHQTFLNLFQIQIALNHMSYFLVAIDAHVSGLITSLVRYPKVLNVLTYAFKVNLSATSC